MKEITVGEVFLRGPFLTCLATLGALLCVIPYAWLRVHLTLPVLLAPAYVVGFAASVGFVVAKASNFVGCRSLLVARVHGAVSGVAAMFLAWVAFASVQLDSFRAEECPSCIELALHPHYLYGFAQWAAENGQYSLFGYIPGVGPTVASWFLEGLIVVVACVAFATRRLRPGSTEFAGRRQEKNNGE